MSSLLVVTGPPGAGKSTVASIIAHRFERSALIDGDAFFRFVVRGHIAPWLPEARSQNEVVTKCAAAAAGGYAKGGYATVYDGVVGPWLLRTFAVAAGLDGLDYVVLLPSVERCVRRVAMRQGHGFHDEPVTRRMHRAFELAGIDPKHVFVDPPDRPDEVADHVLAASAAGVLAYEAAS